MSTVDAIRAELYATGTMLHAMANAHAPTEQLDVTLGVMKALHETSVDLLRGTDGQSANSAAVRRKQFAAVQLCAVA
ncbi:hypothetical protein E6W39_22415 [Kitasatospora acidiphila]|uniref:Uncharacterized protein n=1 Tax=Kitasatospora acidiphila TaxID=2567942 RepID=A0A540W6C2_9ACTN|nr:hypothetical protein [Kitasatospora acidiphila]TQF04477.1 hypothetical protein E6W39_22415 [Kitasatospora acidiphila]